MQDFDYTELQVGTQNQSEDIYYKYILQDERDRDELTTSKEFKFNIPPNKTVKRTHHLKQIFESFFIDIIRAPMKP